MPKRLVPIHAVPPLIEVFNRLAKEILPDVQVFHVLDEPMLEQIRKHCSLAFKNMAADGWVEWDARHRLLSKAG